MTTTTSDSELIIWTRYALTFGLFVYLLPHPNILGENPLLALSECPSLLPEIVQVGTARLLNNRT